MGVTPSRGSGWVGNWYTPGPNEADRFFPVLKQVMQHENPAQMLSDMEARIINIRDSL